MRLPPAEHDHLHTKLVSASHGLCLASGIPTGIDVRRHQPHQRGQRLPGRSGVHHRDQLQFRRHPLPWRAVGVHYHDRPVAGAGVQAQRPGAGSADRGDLEHCLARWGYRSSSPHSEGVAVTRRRRAVPSRPAPGSPSPSIVVLLPAAATVLSTIPVRQASFTSPVWPITSSPRFWRVFEQAPTRGAYGVTAAVLPHRHPNSRGMPGSRAHLLGPRHVPST